MIGRNLRELNNELYRVIVDLQYHQKMQPNGRVDGRALSLAITNAETAELWLTKAIGYDTSPNP